MLKQGGKRKKPYYVKFKVDGPEKQRTLAGSGSATAYEAACKYAYYVATEPELKPKEPRATRRSTAR